MKHMLLSDRDAVLCDMHLLEPLTVWFNNSSYKFAAVSLEKKCQTTVARLNAQLKNQIFVTECMLTKKNYKCDESHEVLVDLSVCIFLSTNFETYMFMT